MNKFDLHTFGLPSFGISDFRLTSFGGDGDGGRKAALPSPDLYYDLSLKSNEHPTRNIIDDMSGNGRHATIYNALYAEGSGYGESGYKGAFVFDGIDDYASIGNMAKGFKTLFMEVVPFKTGGILFDQRMMDAVQVDGRNLMRCSRRKPVAQAKGTSVQNEDGSYNITDSTGSNRMGAITPIEAGQYCSISIRCKRISGSGKSISWYLDANNGYRVIPGTSNIASEYQIYSDTRLINTRDTGDQTLHFLFPSGEIQVDWIKIVAGDKPSITWTPAPEEVFAISNLPNTIAYNGMNPNGVTYINGELNTNKYTDDMQNHRQVITIVNPTDTGHGSARIGIAYDFRTYISSMALYKVIGFYDELTPAQIQKVITKYNLKYEQI